MKIQRLRNQLLLGAVLISILMAFAYTSVASWLVRTQYLEQSGALLKKASGIIENNLHERKNNMLAASRQMASQRNLGSTLWYLSQYAHSGLDRETLHNTYQQLARETRKTGRSANASRIALYDYQGHLVSFSLFDGAEEETGFAERFPTLQFQIARQKIDEEGNEFNLQANDSFKRLQHDFGAILPGNESAHYAVIDGLMSIETHVPIMGKTFSEATGKPETRQLGLVVMVQPLDQSFVSQLSRMTDTEINVFTPNGLSSGRLPHYRQPLWNDRPPGGKEPVAAMQQNEISIEGVGYFQGKIPLYNGEHVVGSIAALHPKTIVERNAWEMIRTLWLIAAATLVFIVPFAWYYATSVSRPLTVLSRIFRGVAHDETEPILRHELALLDKEKANYGEMGDLTRSFLSMHAAINQKIQQINEINASLENTVLERTAALAARELESRTLIENSPDTIARYDRNCRRIYVNPAFVTIAGCNSNELLGKRPSENPGGANAEIYEARIKEVLESGQSAQFELKWTDKDEKTICSHIRLTPEVGLSGEIITVLAVGRDISERMVFENIIWKQANFDALTGLPNRHMFHDRLEQEARMSSRSEMPMALMLIDLDHFKEINDTLGHDRGDVLLVEAAQRITACVRESDTVARLGGDEFTIILPRLDELSNAERVAQNIIDKLAEPFKLGSNEIFVSASIGITFYPDDSAALDVLFKNADQAMYAAKNAGRNRFSYFTPELQEKTQKRLTLTHDLRTALAEAQFLLYYQPIIELRTGLIHKAEALIRWQHPERGLISPLDFIPLAEETGLIIPIGHWVFTTAVQQARQWRKQHDPSFQISINKSPVQIRHEGSTFAEWTNYLAQQDMPGESIAIEITEGLLLNAESGINEKLLKLRDAGIQVAIDDFGTGYSSLAYLKRFDIDYLKIDRSFIHNLGADANDLALCEAIIVMAHKLGLKVIAEGVETPGQRDLLAAAGCDFAQGYLYSKPVPPAQFAKLLPARQNA